MVFLNTNILLLKLTQDLLGPGTVLGSGVTKMVQELGQTPGGASEEEDGLTVHHLISQSKNVGIPHAPTPQHWQCDVVGFVFYLPEWGLPASRVNHHCFPWPHPWPGTLRGSLCIC